MQAETGKSNTILFREFTESHNKLIQDLASTSFDIYL